MELTESDIYTDLGLTPPAPEGEPAPQDDVTGGAPAQSEGADSAGDVDAGGEAQDAGAEGAAEGVSNSNTDGETEPAQTPAPAQIAPPPQEAQPHHDPTGEPGPAGPVEGLDRPAPPEVRGRTNPYTGKPVLTLADYEAYQRAYNADVAAARQREQEEAMRAAGMDPTAISAMIQEAVANDPAVLEAKAMAQAAKAREMEAQRQAAMGWYGEQIKVINALDPAANIKDLDDLAGRDKAAFASMLDQVRRGMSLVDAYKLANYDRLVQAQVAAARQKTRNQAAGKAHLAPLGGKSGPAEDVTVPADVMRQYREMFPSMSDADIRKEYAACLKNAANT